MKDLCLLSPCAHLLHSFFARIACQDMTKTVASIFYSTVFEISIKRSHYLKDYQVRLLNTVLKHCGCHFYEDFAFKSSIRMLQ